MTKFTPPLRLFAGTLLACLALGAVQARAQGGKAAPASFQDCRDCPVMVVVPAGEFTMGTPATEKMRGEEAQHPVKIAAPFAVGKFEVTFAQWDACVAAGGCNGYRPADEGWGRGARPAVNLNWKDAKAYVAWLAAKTGKPYRLLSETEWEYAARAGTTTTFAFGPTISADQANFDASSKTPVSPAGKARGKTLPVGAFAPNAFGLYDMHGNAWEWVEDCWNDTYGPNTPSDGKPALAGECGGRILRGGSWEDSASDIRSGARVGGEQEERSSTDGLRVARDL